jgi:ribosomal protein S18 acetylase RimI-like enzyme
VRDEDEILWTMTDIPFPLFNSILRARLAPGQIDATIRSIITQVELQNVPLLWWTGPMTQPADLGRHLERHGFVNEGQMPGMAVELARLNESLPTPAELSVQRVTDDKSMKVWCQVGVAGFGSPAFLVDAFYDLMRASDPDTNLAYIGWWKDQPVATSLVLLAEGVAGVYNVATIPEACRRGIGAIMTLAPLREARERKYKIGILQASEMGGNVYRSIIHGRRVQSSEHLAQIV